MDTDWTLVADWEDERKLREERSQLIKEQLGKGQTAAYRQSGWSLYPRVHSNDLCSYLPVRFAEQVVEDDIVVCNVRPSGLLYAHIVQCKEWNWENKKWVLWIINIEGKCNGWCWLEDVYGKLFSVAHYMLKQHIARIAFSPPKFARAASLSRALSIRAHEAGSIRLTPPHLKMLHQQGALDAGIVTCTSS